MPQDSHELPPISRLTGSPIRKPSLRTCSRRTNGGSAALAQLAERPDSKIGPYTPASEFSAATETLTLLVRTMACPTRSSFRKPRRSFFRLFGGLWNNVLARMMGTGVQPLISPAPGDNRFKDPEWDRNPFFDFCKQAYLLACKWAEEQLAATPDLDPEERHRAEFYLKQLTSAYSPSNFPVTNPEVLRETLASNRREPSQGREHARGRPEAIGRSDEDQPNPIPMRSNSAAISRRRRKVVFQNELLQLIQYSPTTEKVRERPLIMIRVDQQILHPRSDGFERALSSTSSTRIHRVRRFMGEPDERLANKTFEDYILQGISRRRAPFRRRPASRRSTYSAIASRAPPSRPASPTSPSAAKNPSSADTLLTTQVDFSLAGDLLPSPRRSSLQISTC